METIADTFGISVDAIGRDTTAEDVDGWDSLSHNVLIVRIEKRLGVRVTEEIAMNADTVGALVDGLWRARQDGA